MAKPHLPEELLSANELYERWGLSRKFLRARTADGTITAYRFGHRTVRYNPKEILDKLCITSRDWEVK